MATTVVNTTIYEGGNIIVKKVSIAEGAGDETSAENTIIDLSTLVGPDKSLAPTMVSLLEATWTMSPTFEYVKMYWADEANDSVILEMTGDSAISFRGVGGLHYGVETEAGDGDVLMDFTNATEVAGVFDGTFVFKKKN
jgi:hypothetical protein